MSIKLEAQDRKDKGKGSSRRLRNANRTPAIIYGTNKSALSISLDFYEFSHLLDFNDSIFTSIIDIQIGKKNHSVIIKDLQRHPASGDIIHIDFLRTSDKRLITTSIPLNFIGISDNSLLRLGSILNQFINSVEVKCLPKDLPNIIDVDVTNITLETNIRLTDLSLPKGVDICALTHGDIEAHNQTIVSISPARSAPDLDLEEEKVDTQDNENSTEDDNEESS